ncbi:uncharacterized mitochondrial protein AtMg00820-like [Humulus lupulus]|uniref:uncharacterized mitochondrial protein AtMg00820-like n=1 Tax=Humulus lupulus TaxID=3486 RepID=UPI002B417E9A|nr:uncharacterized mitochondrial protein AtMg00820-like [Humulus lupulus]
MSVVPPLLSQEAGSNDLQPTSSLDLPIAHNIVSAMLNVHLMQTRAKFGIRKPKVLMASIELSFVINALKSQQWSSAMQSEFHALKKNKTWSLVDLPFDQVPIGYKWVYRVKENTNETIARYKARLLAKGFQQQTGFDYNETFSPVVMPVAI